MESKDILKALRKSNGLSMRDVAEGADIPYSTYSKYEYGERELGITPIKKLAAFYNVSTDVIVGVTAVPNENKEDTAAVKLDDFLKEYYSLPVDIRLTVLNKMAELIAKHQPQTPEAPAAPILYISCYSEPASAGTGYYLDENTEPPQELAVVDTPEARKADFALRVRGDSMETSFSDGDIVLVQSYEHTDVRQGDVCVFIQEGEGYIKELGNGFMISHNLAYPPILIQDGTRIVGKVIGKAQRVTGGDACGRKTTA